MKVATTWVATMLVATMPTTTNLHKLNWICFATYGCRTYNMKKIIINHTWIAINCLQNLELQQYKKTKWLHNLNEHKWNASPII